MYVNVDIDSGLPEINGLVVQIYPFDMKSEFFDTKPLFLYITVLKN